MWHLSVASGRAPIGADQILVDGVGVVVGWSDGFDFDDAFGGDSIEHGVELVDVDGAEEDAFSIGVKFCFDTMNDGENPGREDLRAVAADEHLHGLFADFLPDLVDIAFGDEVSAGDEDDAVGDAVDFVEDVAGD